MRVLILLVHGKPHAQAEFGVVFKQRIGPGRPAALAIYGVRSGRQIAAVDGRTSRSVGNEQAVTKQLREELDIRSFAAAGAGAGEFEERLKKLSVFHLRVRDALAVKLGQAHEKVPVDAFCLTQRRLHFHVDGFVLDFALALGRADFHTQPAAGAVFRRDLQRVTQRFIFTPAGFRGLERGRGLGQVRRVIHLGANCSVRANQHALAALDAQFRIPNGNLLRKVALFPLCGGGRESAVVGHGADGQGVAVSGDDGSDHLAHKSRCTRGHRGEHFKRRGDFFGDLYLVQARERLVDGREILLHHGLATLAISFLDGFFDGGNGFLAGKDAADGEKARLHNGIDAVTHARFSRHAVGINDIKFELLVDDGLLNLAW